MEELKHSGLGIAATVIGGASTVLIFMLFMVAGVMELSTPGGVDEESTAALLVGLCLILLVGALAVGLGLGIAGLCQRGRNKLFPILGTVFSSLTLIGAILLVLVGMAME
ncbi:MULTISPECIES: hypothetical protein [Pseudomonas]|uniref:Major facilitator superfamily (MFS) profile domain-containing protein n=1 Tax=Pseudomonas abyssi TaxID=170540 RepID=A0A395R9T0_9PSED|nr:hypothetical protein [Halopseudomonas gallaeciensis]MAG67628.1 hypothetical protein [Pseudomonadales bacterium]RGP56572.1 hypothetical protein ASB58_04190 [Halopseudomonas gallaeciensis]|tara:strand:+ start:2535 stop:2864 length:330 start_codon:yes stop_codon:yes gene_type:complete